MCAAAKRGQSLVSQLPDHTRVGESALERLQSCHVYAGLVEASQELRVFGDRVSICLGQERWASAQQHLWLHVRSGAVHVELTPPLLVRRMR